ncbi:MAG: hypothetical protein O3C01_07060 [Bacteroidetes bacterium]|jgi:hypothetical protein|nr:MAG: hypothetical protein ABR90_03295 [Cryomorphaceae bacterium BACL29 MAG-121220-bin8]MDA0758406.1 hypothetical protein [Bacteroidota bacterium]MDA1018936.1 hypothetical protein [Bacteroidota bacterium]
MKIRKISEYIYLIISIIATLDYLFGNNIDQRKNILLLFAIISLGMFFFRRYYRKKIQNRIK